MHLKLRKLLALCLTGVMMISSGLSSFPIYAAEPSPSVTIEYEGSGRVMVDGEEIPKLGKTITTPKDTTLEVKAIADDGYVVKDVTFNGVTQPKTKSKQVYSSSYTVTKEKKQKISVTFQADGKRIQWATPKDNKYLEAVEKQEKEQVKYNLLNTAPNTQEPNSSSSQSNTEASQEESAEEDSDEDSDEDPNEITEASTEENVEESTEVDSEFSDQENDEYSIDLLSNDEEISEEVISEESTKTSTEENVEESTETSTEEDSEETTETSTEPSVDMENLDMRKAYILEHMDQSKVGTPTGDLIPTDVVLISNTLFTSGKLENKTMDGLWADEDGDGMSDHWQAFAGQYNSLELLYEADPDADYFVGKVDTLTNDYSQVTDFLAGKNDTTGTLYDDIVYDYDTGLVYVPKTYLKKNDKGEVIVNSIRMQLLYEVSDTTSFETTIKIDSNDPELNIEGVIQNDLYDGETHIQLTYTKRAREVLTADLENVEINGVSYSAKEGIWSFDPQTGILTIFRPAATIDTIKVNAGGDGETFVNQVQSAIEDGQIPSWMEDAAEEIQKNPNWVDDVWDSIKDYFVTDVHAIQQGGIQTAAGTWEFNGCTPTQGMSWIVQSTNKYLVGWNGGAVGGYTTPVLTIDKGTLAEPAAVLVQKICVNATDFKEPYYISPGEILRTAEIKEQVLNVPSGGTIHVPAQNLALYCAHAGVTDAFNRDDNYSDNSSPTDQKGAKVVAMRVTEASMTVGVIVPTTYTQSGVGMFNINIRAEGTPPPPEVEEKPKSKLDQLGLLLVKMDEDWHKPKPQGDASLAGAIFKFEFWEDPDPQSDAPTSTSGKPTRTWYFKTDNNGMIWFDNEHKVSGDDFYYEKGNPDPGVPKGVIRITEDTPPPGYHFAKGDSDHPMPIEIQVDPKKTTDGLVTSYVTPDVHDEVWKGELHLRKVITDGHESELVEYEEGAEFVAIAKKYVTKWGSFEEALEHLGEYGPQEWERYTTDKDGYGQPEKTGQLAYGRYVVKQTKVGKEEHQILKDPFEVNFDHDGQVIDIVINNIPNKYWTRIVKKDADTGKTVTLNHATFQIIKKKEDGSIDRLYGDNDSGALVRTDENGVVLVKSGANNWYDHFTTRSDGTLVSIPRNFVGTENDPEGSVAVPVQLPYGKYVLKETNIPDGYLHGIDLEFTLKEEFALEQDEDGDCFLTLEFENPKPKGKIIITKTFEDPNNIMHGVVSFDLIVRDDIIDPADGKILYHAGDLYGHYELKDNRKIVIDNLPMGVGKSSFIVKEHSTYENYQLDLSEKVVIFEQKDKESGEVDLTTPEYVDDSAQFHNKLIKISTTAKAENGTHDQQAKKGKTTLTDTVAYEGLIHNRDYTLRAELMDKETGKPLLDAQGAPYKVEHTFTAIEENGTVDVPFVIDSEQLAGKDVVFFETLLNGMHGHTQCEIASHKDIKDENQTLHFFEIKTKAQSESKTNEQQIKDGVVKLTDTVSYNGLRVGTEYVLKGTLMDKSTGGKLMKNGKPVTARARFTPKETEGTIDVVFEVDLSDLKSGNSLVVFEELLLGDVIIGEHKDLEDQAQTVKLIDIHTEAQSDNKHHLKQVEKDKTTLVDKVSYEGLTVGEKYTLKGVLMDQKSGEKVLDDGKEVTGEMTFTPKTSSGDVNVEFKFNSKALVGKTVVVFETLEHNKIPVAKHEDLKDEKQTLYIFDLKTNAVNKSKSHEQQVTKEKVTITDTVSYDGLKVGEKYTLKGILMDKETGKPIFINADNVKAESKFTPKQSKGTVEVNFEVDVHNLKPDTSLVVFEELYIGEEKVGSHSDINAKDQTINIIDLKTKVESSKGSQVELAGKDVVLKDKVSYEGLMVDEEYVLKGVLMDKETGKPLQVNGKEVTAEKSFKPKASKGEVIVEFKVDSSKLAGKKVVVFETLIHNGIEVGAHKDINDKDQTMEFKHYEVKVNKVDSVTKKNIVSNKFEFTMYKDAECKQVEKTLPGAQDTGIATFEVKDGVWYIKESKAPKGYILSDEVVKVEVKDAKLFVNDKEVKSDENYVYSIVYENSLETTTSKNPDQPNKKAGANTATQTNALLWGGILAVAVCGLGIAFVIKKKSKK